MTTRLAPIPAAGPARPAAGRSPVAPGNTPRADSPADRATRPGRPGPARTTGPAEASA